MNDQILVDRPVAGAVLNVAHPLARGVVGCWLLNEMSGTRVMDLSPQGNHGSLTNFASPPPRAFNGLVFDGSNDFVNCGSHASLDIPDAVTDVSVVCWLNLGTPTDNNPAPLFKGGQGNSQAGYTLMGGGAGNQTKFFFQISDGGGAAGDSSASTSTVALANTGWRMLVGYADRRLGRVGIFLDGRLSGSAAIGAGTGTLTNPTQAVNLGGGGTSFSVFGRIALAMIYRARALSALEVAELFKSPYKPMGTPLFLGG